MIKIHFDPTLPNFLPIGTNLGAEKLPTSISSFFAFDNYIVFQ
jgi:hypothetical protein